MKNDVYSEDNRELGKKLDALLGLLIMMGRQHLGWRASWVAQYLSEFDLPEDYISATAGVTIDKFARDAITSKPGKLRKPSFLDRFKED